MISFSKFVYDIADFFIESFRYSFCSDKITKKVHCGCSVLLIWWPWIRNFVVFLRTIVSTINTIQCFVNEFSEAQFNAELDVLMVIVETFEKSTFNIFLMLVIYISKISLVQFRIKLCLYFIFHYYYYYYYYYYYWFQLGL